MKCAGCAEPIEDTPIWHVGLTYHERCLPDTWNSKHNNPLFRRGTTKRYDVAQKLQGH